MPLCNENSTRAEGSTWSWTKFAYDTFNRRVEADVVGGDRRGFAYDGWRILDELGFDSLATRTNPTAAPNRLLGRNYYGADLDEILLADRSVDPDGRGVSDGNLDIRSVPVTDFLGSTERLLEPNGDVAVTFTYGLYGETTATCAENPCVGEVRRDYLIGFTGYRLDDFTALSRPLYYGRNREYDPEMGRFVQQDPLGTAAGPNVYEYAAGSPTAFVDPLGLYIRGNAEAWHWERVSRSRNRGVSYGSSNTFDSHMLGQRDPLMSALKGREDGKTRLALPASEASRQTTVSLVLTITPSGTEAGCQCSEAGSTPGFTPVAGEVVTVTAERESLKNASIDVIIQNRSSSEIPEHNLDRWARHANVTFGGAKGKLKRTKVLKQDEKPTPGHEVVYVRVYDNPEQGGPRAQAYADAHPGVHAAWLGGTATEAGEAQIWWNRVPESVATNLNWEASRNFFANTLAHETGHSMGLWYPGAPDPGHNPDTSSVMSEYSGTGKRLNFQESDFQIP